MISLCWTCNSLRQQNWILYITQNI